MVDPLSYFSFQLVLHDWINKGRGMCYPVCGMIHIKNTLLLIRKSSLCGGSGFLFRYLCGPLHITVNKSYIMICNVHTAERDSTRQYPCSPRECPKRSFVLPCE